MSCGFLPVSIVKENRLNYYNALDKYAVKGFLYNFTNMLARTEPITVYTGNVRSVINNYNLKVSDFFQKKWKN